MDLEGGEKNMCRTKVRKNRIYFYIEDMWRVFVTCGDQRDAELTLLRYYFDAHLIAAELAQLKAKILYQ